MSLFFVQTPNSSYSLQFAGIEDETYAGATLILVAPDDFKPGDADKNGTVDAVDAAILAANWQMQSGATWADGDFNGDHMVNDIDATLMATNWQSTTGGSSASVPEPGTITLLLSVIGAVFLALYRQKRQITGS